MTIHRIPMSLERQCQWRHYQRSLEMAAQHINAAQEVHRQLFGEESAPLLSAAMTVSIEYDRTAQPPKEPA